MRTLAISLAAAAIVAGASAAPASADPTTLRVCPAGCDATTIQGAVDLAHAGDTIAVDPGTPTT